MSLKLEPETMEISSLSPPPQPTAPSILPPPPDTSTTTTLASFPTSEADASPSQAVESPRIELPHVNGNSNGMANSTTTLTAPSKQTEEVVARGPLGLAPDEEEWVRGKMEYALHDFEVLTLAIKRYKWQLGQVPKDVARLQSLKEKHMEDPYEFVRQLKTKEFRYPENQKTLPVPAIEWSKYQFPPANPIVPSKPGTVGFLSSNAFTSNNDRSNIVSLNSSGRSRAGSPANERLRAVKDTARSLGIHVSSNNNNSSNNSSNSSNHQQHTSHSHHRHQPSQDTIGSTAIRIDGLGTGGYAEDAQNLPESESSAAPITAFIEARPLSRQPSQEFVQQEREYSQPPSVAALHSSDMEGVTYSTAQPVPAATVPRARSATVTENATIQHYPVTHVTPPTQHAYSAPLETKTEGSSYVIQHNVDPNLGLGSISQSSNLLNRNITYNHMSGNVIDIQPSTSLATSTSKPKAASASREGSGAREDLPKPPLFNIPWSDDEQRLLEQLLDEYPDEPVAAQRFQKISAAMGTRTPKQVASRVQKYFIKLVKAGLEAPGRMNYSLEPTKPKPKGTSPIKGKKRKEGPPEGTPKPKVSRPRKKEEGGAVGGSRSGSSAPSTKKQKPKSLLGSGFGRTSGTQYLNYSTAPTVYMSEEDDEENVQDMMGVSNSYGTPAPNDGVISHLGFACDSCGVEPILGTRYTCMNCEEFGGTDLCGPCFYSGNYHTEYHLVSHRFQSIDTAETPAYGSDYGRPASAGPSSSVYYS